MLLLLLRPTDHLFYQDLKTVFLTVVPLPQDVLHVVVGLLAMFVSVVAFRRSPASFTAVVLGLTLSLVMEAFDLYDGNLMVSRYDWSASLRDLVTTNLLPFAIVWYNRSRDVRDSGDEASRPGLRFGRG